MLNKFSILAKQHYRGYFLLAVVVYVAAAYLNIGHNTPDEYYQIFETAGYKLGFISFSRLPWEIHAEMRSAFQTLILVKIYKLYSIIMVANPFVISFIMRLLSAGLALVSTALFCQAFIIEIATPKYQKWLVVFALFNPLTVCSSIHFNSENIVGHLLLIVLSLLKMMSVNKKPFLALALGLGLALIFTLRFQMGFAIAGVCAWLVAVDKIKLKSLVMVLAGILIGILLFNIYIDHWFYHKWLVTPYNYLYQNLILNKAANFGSSPWYSYFLLTLGLLPYGPAYVVSYLLFIYKQPKHLSIWLSIPFLVAHMLIGHKELRFLMPMLFITPLWVIWAVEYVSTTKKHWLTAINKTYIMVWKVSLVGYVMVFFPASSELGAWQFIYNRYQQPTLYFYTHSSDWVNCFYLRPNLKFIPVDNIQQVHCEPSANCLYGIAATNDQYTEPYKLVYSFLPKWLESVTILSRQISHINVYEIQNIEH